MTKDQQQFLSVLAYFYLQHGQAEKARILLQAGLPLMPEQLDYLKMLAYASIATGRADDALEALSRYGQRAPAAAGPVAALRGSPPARRPRDPRTAAGSR